VRAALSSSCRSRGARWLGLALAGAAGWVLAFAPARADEPMFGYVNTTDLLPATKAQVEQWVTARAGRWEGRSEAEFGLADNLQLTGYLNYSGGDGATRFDGATVEAAWRLASPYLSPVGLALVADATAGRGPGAARLRGVIQKNLRDDTIILAANVVAELRGSPRSSALELDLGASWRFRANWSAGLEYRHLAAYAGHGLGGSALTTADYLGPNLHYGAQRWFFTLSALRRVGASASAPLAARPRPARWDGVRFRVGRTF
jgi:hypothetical protein